MAVTVILAYLKNRAEFAGEGRVVIAGSSHSCFDIMVIDRDAAVGAAKIETSFRSLRC